PVRRPAALGHPGGRERLLRAAPHPGAGTPVRAGPRPGPAGGGPGGRHGRRQRGLLPDPDRGGAAAVSRWQRALPLLASFAMGFAVAIWLLPVMAGPTVQRLRLERDFCLARVETLEAEVARLEQAERRRPVVCQVARVRAEIEGP